MQTPETPDEATPIAEYFARDPMQHTKKSLDAVIDHIRSQRHRYKAGDKTAGSPKPPSKTQKAQQAAMDLGGDLLKDLDL